MDELAEPSRSPTPGTGDLRPHSKVWVEHESEVALSEWRVELLEAVGETGSLVQAAERMGVPYRTAWNKIREIEGRLGVRLLDTTSGGADGGGSRLTAEADDLIARFHRVSDGIAELVERRFRAEFGDTEG